MVPRQQLAECDIFSQELALKQLVSGDRVSIIYIHGTARSGSTIAEIILAQLADLVIHQPFRGTLQKTGGRFRSQKLDEDADIYDLACGSITRQISQCLDSKRQDGKQPIKYKKLTTWLQSKTSVCEERTANFISSSQKFLGSIKKL